MMRKCKVQFNNPLFFFNKKELTRKHVDLQMVSLVLMLMENQIRNLSFGSTLTTRNANVVKKNARNQQKVMGPRSDQKKRVAYPREQKDFLPPWQATPFAGLDRHVKGGLGQE